METRKSSPDKKENPEKASCHPKCNVRTGNGRKEQSHLRKIADLRLVCHNRLDLRILSAWERGRLLEFLKKALSDGRHVALPRTGADCTMEFYEITSLEQTAEAHFTSWNRPQNAAV